VELRPRLPTRGCAGRCWDARSGAESGAGPGPGAGLWASSASSSSRAARLYLSTRSSSSVFFRSRDRGAKASRHVGQAQGLPAPPAPHTFPRQSRQKLWPQGSVVGQTSNPWQMMQLRSSSPSHTGIAELEARPAMVSRPPPPP
jgi:hypothetical protein